MKKTCKKFTEDCYQHPKCLKTLEHNCVFQRECKKAHAKKCCMVGCGNVNCEHCGVHKIGKHGAVSLVGKNGDICGECRKEVKKEFTGINPLKQKVYERLEKMKLKDLADKIEEIISRFSKMAE